MKDKLIQGWKEVTLGEVAEFVNGRAFKPEEWEKSGKIIIRIQDLTNSLDSPNFTTKTFEDKYLVKRGDLLISWSATLDAFIWNKEEGWLNQHIFKVIEKKDILDRKFLYYLVRNKIDDFKKQTHGSTMRHITKDRFTSMKLLLPPLSTQQEIVSILEKADQARELRKEADELTKDFLKAVFFEMFGDPKTNNKKWPIVKIGDCIDHAQYGTSSKSNDKKKGYPIVGMNNISSDGNINLSKYNYVDISMEEFEKLRLCDGDVIFNRTNSPELIGKTACWNKDMDAVLASYLVKLKMKDNCHPLFFTYLMNTTYFKKLFYSGSKKAVNQANISPTLLKTFLMYLPPIKLQREFALVIERIDKIRDYQNQSGQQITNLLGGLMQRAFRGEIAC